MKEREASERASARSFLLLCLHDDDPEDRLYLRGDPAVLRSTLNSDDILALSTDFLFTSLITNSEHFSSLKPSFNQLVQLQRRQKQQEHARLFCLASSFELQGERETSSPVNWSSTDTQPRCDAPARWLCYSTLRRRGGLASLLLCNHRCSLERETMMVES